MIDPSDPVAPLAVLLARATAPRFASLVAAEAAIGSVTDGQLVYITAENGYYARVDGVWVVLWQDTGWVNVPLRAGFTHSTQLQVRRIGLVVYAQGRVTGALTTGNVIIGDI